MSNQKTTPRLAVLRPGAVRADGHGVISAPAPDVQEANRSPAELKIGLSVGTAPMDFITVATAADRKLMTKIFFVGRDGREQTRNFDKGYLFNFSTRPVACLDDLARVLDGLKQHSCVIYGRLIEGTSMPCRRLLNTDAKTGDAATIEDAAHSWVLLDIDKLAIEGDVFDPVTEPERAAEFIRAKLPPEFEGARCLWRLTSSAGVGKRDTISMRLGFWLDRALTGAQAKAWLTGTMADCTIYTPNQVIYAAKPVFVSGRVDPVGRRSGIVEGRVTVTPAGITATFVKVPGRVEPKPKVAPREAPEGVVFDTEAAVAAGRGWIKRALASDEWQEPRPTPTGARAYRLAARLKDEALSPEMIVDLFVELVPWFDEEDRPALAAMVESVFLHGQNDPGCGPTNGVTHLFGAIVAEWEAEADDGNELWDQIIRSSQGALQRLPDAPPPTSFPPGLTAEVQRIIAEDRAELARRLK
jgi:hypothetical protein